MHAHSINHGSYYTKSSLPMHKAADIADKSCHLKTDGSITPALNVHTTLVAQCVLYVREHTFHRRAGRFAGCSPMQDDEHHHHTHESDETRNLFSAGAKTKTASGEERSGVRPKKHTPLNIAARHQIYDPVRRAPLIGAPRQDIELSLKGRVLKMDQLTYRPDHPHLQHY